MSIQQEGGTFDAYAWKLVGGSPLAKRWTSPSQIPARIWRASDPTVDPWMRGFRFVGPTICYAYMQATGLIMDHLTSCFRFGDLGTPKPSCSESQR